MPKGTTIQAVRNILRDHEAMIQLNPLTFEQKVIEPPSFASAEEQSFKWYEVRDHIHYLPCGSIDYQTGFCDGEDGLETHTYAPMGVQIVSLWTVTGPEKLEEVGMDEDTEFDVYLREDVELTCSFVLRSSIQWTMMNSHREMAKRLGEKAVVLSISQAQVPTGRVGET